MTVIAPAALDSAAFSRAVEVAAHRALETGAITVLVGVDELGRANWCDTGCCVHRRDGLLLVPDLALLESVANTNLDVPPDQWRVVTGNGREVFLFWQNEGDL